MYKKILFAAFSVLFLLPIYSYSQVAINNTGNAPNSNSILDIDVSTNNKGILIPRLTSAQRIAMVLAASEEGLTVYDETTNSYWLWDGATWLNFDNSWKTTGNAGTVDGIHFIGTTDNVPFSIRTNNIVKARFTTKGQIEILNTGNSVFIGENAGAGDDLSVNGNVAIGMNALSTNVTGTGNVAIGYTAMKDATSDGVDNVAVGFFALQNNQGDNNVALGRGTMARNTTGSYNAAVGSGALFYNTTGNNNTAVGANSLLNNLTGISNVAVGYEALLRMTANTGNVAVGTQAMRENLASENAVVGDSTGYANIGAEKNAFLGCKVGKNFKYGNSNVGIGWRALFAFNGVDAFGADIPVNGFYSGNVAIGQQSMYYTPGTSNVAVGLTSMFANGGTDNVAVGHDAQGQVVATNNGTAIGAYSEIRADNATAIGARAQATVANTLILGSINGINGATANVNVGIRTQAPTSALEVKGEIKTSDDVNGFLTLGRCDNISEGGQINFTGAGTNPNWYEDLGGADHRLFVNTALTPKFNIFNIGTGNVNLQIDGQAYKPGGGSWVVSSDRRSKENIKDYTSGLNELMRLHPVSFNYKEEFHWGNATYVGLIAQEVEKIIPTMVSENPTNGIDDFKTIDPNELTYILINSVKELKKQNDDLQKQISRLKAQVDKN